MQLHELQQLFAEALLSETGFACGETWYHGTSSALLASILEQGLKGSGDQALQQAERHIRNLLRCFSNELAIMSVARCRSVPGGQ